MSILEQRLIRHRVIKNALINGKPRTLMPEYPIFAGMLARCNNSNTPAYARYGGRGIRVCDRWQEDFANFYADMGPRPSKRHSIDRIDNNGNYEPSNCRWATPAEQAANKPQGGRADSWSQAELVELRRRFEQFDNVADIAKDLGRSLPAVRLRLHNIGARRPNGFTQLLRKFPTLKHVLIESGKAEFLDAVARKRLSDNLAEKAQKQRNNAETKGFFDEIANGAGSRNEKMKKLRLAGFTLNDIGEHFGLSRERVRQLQEKNFDPAPPGRKVYETKLENRNRQVDRLIAAWNRASVSARQAFLDVAVHSATEALPRLPKGDAA